MKPNLSDLAVPYRHLAAALLLSVLPAAGQTIPNPSFEANSFSGYPGYISGNTAITGWTADIPGRAGLNPAGSSPFADNGTIPNGLNVAFIQAGGGATKLTTTVTGLVIGTKYNVTMRLNARNGNQPSLVFASDGTGPTVAVGVAAVGGTNPYRTGAFEFTATATSQNITLTNDRAAGDHTLLVDDLKIAPSDNAWSFAAWTGDTDSGIDSQYIYTHAISFGSNTPVTVNGVKFNGGAAGAPGPFAVTGLTSSFGNGGPNLTGDSVNLGKDFRYAGNPSITLNNLKPATEYVCSIYGFGWDGAGVYRSATFTSSVPGSQALSVNLNQYGQKNGMVVNYRYTTDAVGTPVTISYPPTDGTNTFHTAGFSNREATPGTQPVRWTAEPWNDDATSGVSPNHVYTIAYNFNSATDVNVNGVKFTGAVGANPSVNGLLTSGLTALYGGDTNTVTGYGAALAKDFLYSGNPEIYNLGGLVPGRDYVLTLYSVGFDADRPLSLTGAPGEQPTILNQAAFGNNQGVRFEYRYKAEANGLATIYASGFNPVNTLHCYAISNREADPMTGVAPVITLQPAKTVIGVGKSLVLRVGATGSATLTYQWKRNGSDISGATAPILDLGDADYSEAGNYSVVVTNGVSSTPSDTVEVKVYDNIPGLFGTGVGVDGAILAGGKVDTHYSLLVNPDSASPATYVQTNLPGSWLQNSTTSKWIGPRADTAAAAAMTVDAGEGFGNYVYRTTVDLTGFTLSTVQIAGAWASDNFGTTIRVNGVAVVGSANDVGITFGAFKSFTIDSGNATLNAGVNTIDFVINNADLATGFTGLRVESLVGVGEIPTGTAPHIAVKPVGGSPAHYAQFPLAVGASGSAVLTYRWYKNEVLISGETEPLLVVSIDAPDAAGNYKVVVGNGTAPDAVSDTVAITIPNAIPVAADDALSTNKNTLLPIDPAANLFGNDTDADMDVLELQGFSTPTANGGTVSESLGILTYTPPSGFVGVDSFTYTVKDGWGGISAAATVNITVLDVSTPPGQLVLTVNLAGGTVSGAFTGTAGVTYTLQRSTTLMNDWLPIDTVVAPPSGIVNVQDANPPLGKAFYRISYPD